MLVCSLNKLNAARAGNSDRALEMLPCQNASSMVAMTVSSGLDDMHLIGRGMGGLARDVGCAELVRDWGNYWHHRLERVRWDDIKRQRVFRTNLMMRPSNAGCVLGTCLMIVWGSNVVT